MAVRVIEAPEMLVSLEEAKRTLAIRDDKRDELIEMRIRAAQKDLDGPDGWLGRALGTQTLEWSRDDFCPEMFLPYPDLIEIVSVKYVDRDGATQTVPDTVYEIRDGLLCTRAGERWPSARYQAGAVTIRYRAGMAADDPRLEQARLAILTHVKMTFDMENPEIYEKVIYGLVGGLRVMRDAF